MVIVAVFFNILVDGAEVASSISITFLRVEVAASYLAVWSVAFMGVIAVMVGLTISFSANDSFGPSEKIALCSMEVLFCIKERSF